MPGGIMKRPFHLCTAPAAVALLHPIEANISEESIDTLGDSVVSPAQWDISLDPTPGRMELSQEPFAPFIVGGLPLGFATKRIEGIFAGNIQFPHALYTSHASHWRSHEAFNPITQNESRLKESAP
jgi:hypothetical protein